MLLDACQRILNRCVAESTAARQTLASLEGTSLRLDVDGTDISIRVSVADGEARLVRGDGSSADAVLRATPLDLLRLLGDASLGELKATGVELSGTIHVAESYAELVRFARPDVEDELAGWVGDIAAHEIGTMAQRLSGWSGRARRALELDAAEYLREESAMLVGPLDLRRFSADVEDLRDAVERAEERLAALARTRAART